MIRPLPPVNPLMWPHRAAIRRMRDATPGQTSGYRDTSGGRVDRHSAAEPPVRCNVLGASVDTVPDLAVMGTKIKAVVVFPDDVRLAEGDTMTAVDEDGKPWGKVLTVVRYQRLGLYTLRRWQADCDAT
jgi:hypothetical protein